MTTHSNGMSALQLQDQLGVAVVQRSEARHI
jgi:hypothetical protein